MALAPKKIVEELSSSLQVLEDDLVLPSIPYDCEALDEIIVELEISPDVEAKLLEYIKYINKQVLDVKKYQAKRHPENFYQAMRTAVLNIRNTATAIYELTKNYHQTLPNTLKELILKWITPLEAELEKRIEMPAAQRGELDLKTKHLYAEQSFISRQASLQQTLMQYLGELKELLLVSDHPAPRCYLSYAWPSEQYKAQEYWVQPFLYVLYDHLTAAGIRVVMDIRDNNPGDSIYQFMKQYHEGNYIVLVGTESLLEKHYGKGAHAVQTELSIINNRFEQDQNESGQSRIYPILISGTMKSAYPEIYDKYHTVRDTRDAGYVGTLKKLIDWVYEDSVKQKALEHSSLWQSFYHQYSGLPKEDSAVEQELSLGYHRQRLEFLTQDTEYQVVQAQEQTPHSQAVQAEQIGALMKSQGTNPQLFYDGNGFEFQRRPYANPDFIMRQGLWDKMTSYFAQSDQQILTLTAHGLGGMGKTELAGYYYLHPPRPYALRAWFHAEKKEQLYYQYIALTAEHSAGVKFSKEMPVEEQARRIKGWLENQKDCLLVYDNVSDTEEVAELLPNKGKHHILITSRNAVVWPVHQMLDVDVMEEAEAIALICKITGYRVDDSSIKQLVETLGYLPLALAQAAAYISTKKMNVDEYLNYYQKKQAEVLSEVTRRHPKHELISSMTFNTTSGFIQYDSKYEPVWITFDINFEDLKKNCPEALLTLKQAAWLRSDGIPEVLLQIMAINFSADKEKLWFSIKENLSLYSLMRINVAQHQLSIHPLLQNILRYQQEPEEQKMLITSISKQLICFLDKSKVDLSYLFKNNWDGKEIIYYSEWIINCESFLQQVLFSKQITEDVISLAYHLGSYFYDKRDYDGVIRNLEKIEEKISLLSLKQLLANTYREKGILANNENNSTPYFNKAETLYKKDDINYLKSENARLHVLIADRNSAKTEDRLLLQNNIDIQAAKISEIMKNIFKVKDILTTDEQLAKADALFNIEEASLVVNEESCRVIADLLNKIIQESNEVQKEVQKADALNRLGVLYLYRWETDANIERTIEWINEAIQIYKNKNLLCPHKFVNNLCVAYGKKFELKKMEEPVIKKELAKDILNQIEQLFKVQHELARKFHGENHWTVIDYGGEYKNRFREMLSQLKICADQNISQIAHSSDEHSLLGSALLHAALLHKQKNVTLNKAVDASKGKTKRKSFLE